MLPPAHVTHVAGFPTTTLARTCFDLAAEGFEVVRIRYADLILRPKREMGAPESRPPQPELAVVGALIGSSNAASSGVGNPR